MTRVLQCVVEPALAPARIAARHGACLRAARADGGLWLHVYRAPTAAVSLGRYLPAPPVGAVPCVRRYSGGRVAPLGPGFLGVGLALPHRSALVGDDPLALSPEQVLNRAVRGLMAAFKGLGIEVFYPGRDLLTVQGRACAVVSFSVEADGTALFEAIVAIDDDFTLLPGLVDRADPSGVVRIDMWQPTAVAALSRTLPRSVEVVELGERIAAGYASTFDLAAATATLAADEGDSAIPWPLIPMHLNRRVSVSTMLGALEIHTGLTSDGRLSGLRLVGDLIADPAGVAALEQAVTGCVPDVDALRGAISSVFDDPTHFLLGVGPVDDLADVIVRAVR